MRVHGHAKRTGKTNTYHAWASMRSRCLNPARPDYIDYGGRGITICERWAAFENFLADMGEQPLGLSLDRIDNEGNYEPGNCRWATASQQARNRSTTKFIEYAGERLCINEWAVRIGIHKRTLHSRFESGWPTEKALTAPADERQRRVGQRKPL